MKRAVHNGPLLRYICYLTKSNGGGYSANFSLLVFFTFSITDKTSINYSIPRICLVGVAIALLRRHLSNINVIRGIWRKFAWSKSVLVEKLTQGALVTPSPGLCIMRSYIVSFRIYQAYHSSFFYEFCSMHCLSYITCLLKDHFEVKMLEKMRVWFLFELTND